MIGRKKRKEKKNEDDDKKEGKEGTIYFLLIPYILENVSRIFVLFIPNCSKIKRQI